MEARFVGVPGAASHLSQVLSWTRIPTLLKMEFEGGGVVLKFHFKIQFLQSCFLNDQYSSSFHVNGQADED